MIQKLAIAAFLIGSLIQQGAYAATGSQPAENSPSTAVLTDAYGTVFKRDFENNQRESWKSPEPAKSGDTLKEGSQVGTGLKSWAQVTWPEVTSRLWENTVFAIAPNQRVVYLFNGDMLISLKKDKPTNKDYLIWTKVLECRVRGTTVRMESSNNKSRVLVEEGQVNVKNLLDNSEVTLGPGMIYEVSSNQSSQDAQPSPMMNLCPTSTPIPIFTSDKSQSAVYPVDPEKILDEPLWTGCGDHTLPTQTKVKDALSSPQSYCKHNPKDKGHFCGKDNLNITKVPDCNYKNGPMNNDIAMAPNAMDKPKAAQSEEGSAVTSRTFKIFGKQSGPFNIKVNVQSTQEDQQIAPLSSPGD